MCKICGRDTIKKVINKIEYDFCPFCGFLAKIEKHILTSEDEFERYLKHNNSNNDGYMKYQHNFFLEIKDFLGNLNLDFGCGANHILADILNKNNYKTNYYDLYFYPTENYEKHLYDAIILEEVIEHLPFPLTTLEHLINLINCGGKLIIRTRLIPQNFESINWWYLRDLTHISFFDFKTFIYLCEHFNIRCIYCNGLDLIILQKE